ncbi:MAG TPA: hypothetical protein VG815_08785, partial [Chloroflexota bacterium]|nr:hypothetical protein [Chloroflexota bacterium]
MRKKDMAGRRIGNRFWLNALDLTARSPWLGAVVGLALVAALVPILISVGGYSEELRPSIPLLFL